MFKAILIGKSNTGKSSLFNRFVQDKSIVMSESCSTRDIRYANARIGDINFLLGDSCGIDLENSQEFYNQVIKINKDSIESSDLILFMLDNRVLQDIDFQFLKFILKKKKKCLVLVNKSELILDLDKNYFKAAKDYPILEISAKHKIGFENLYLEIKKIISEFELITTDQNESTEILKIAICGRANVGKSSFINNLIGENRVITSSVSGTTSDSIEIDWKYKNKKIKIFDTSGLNRRFALTSKSNQSLEYFSAKHTLKSIKKSMISFLILDATCDLTVQDLKIANYVLEAQKSLIIIVNKIDLIEDKRRFYKSFREILEFKIPQIKNIYLSFISAKNKYKIYSPMDLSLDVFNNFQLKIPTSKINSWIQKKIKDYPLPFAKMPGKKVKIKYLTQTCSFPLKFKVFVNLPEFITNSYKRYLLNSLVQDFSLKSIPIEMCFVKNFNPYSK